MISAWLGGVVVGSTEHGQAGGVLGDVVSRAFYAVTGRPLLS